MKTSNTILTAALLAICSPGLADPAPAIIHYAPNENLENVDVALIDTAKHEIDFAAYVLTDWPVMRLARAADQLAEPARVFLDLTRTLGVEIHSLPRAQ